MNACVVRLPHVKDEVKVMGKIRYALTPNDEIKNMLIDLLYFRSEKIPTLYEARL